MALTSLGFPWPAKIDKGPVSTSNLNTTIFYLQFIYLQFKPQLTILIGASGQGEK